jgi:hypothetical protein
MTLCADHTSGSSTGFADTPDLSAFDFIPNQIPLDTLNPVAITPFVE